MSGLCWMAVMLAFFLSVENSVAAIDETTLATIVNAILGRYRITRMFSLAVRIPYNQNQNLNENLNQVFTTDPANNVLNTMNNDQVYAGNRVVAAKFLERPNGGRDHAESRVVDHLNHLLNRRNVNDHDLLLFYVYASPCVERCSSNTHTASILQRITPIRQWVNYAVVFSVIYYPPWQNTDQDRSGALQRLGASVGLENIYRCDSRQCTSCSTGGRVTPYCVSDSSQGLLSTHK